MRRTILFLAVALALPACSGLTYVEHPTERIQNDTTKTVVVYIVKFDGTETRYVFIPPGEGLTFWGNCRAGLVARDSAGNILERHACLMVSETWVIQSPPP